MTRNAFSLMLCLGLAAPSYAGSQPFRARRGMVVSESALASQVGVAVLADGGNAVDAAVATAFALAVTWPAAGNIGGGGFLVWRSAGGAAAAYDFRETAPAASRPDMFLRDGKYDEQRHYLSHLSVGVPGSVAGLHLAWKENGRLPWKRLVEPAVALARDGFAVNDHLARSLKSALPVLRHHPASRAQFSKDGTPYVIGDVLKQPDLATTLERIAEAGPPGFYVGETARLVAEDMRKNGGILTEADLKAYTPRKREPIRGTYRGHEILSMPPVSSGGLALVEMLNVLEGYDLKALGYGGAAYVHTVAETMRRAFADRARYVGDPEFNPAMPVARLGSKEHAAELRRTIQTGKASRSEPTRFEWPKEGGETTHLSVVDAERNAVSLTTTLQELFGSKIVAPGTGFLLNNEMSDFNPVPGKTDTEGVIGTEPNLVAPGKRMLSSMTPAIVVKDGRPFLVIGSPGGRTIINTVLLCILNVVDFGMNVQEAVDAGRFHHQWLPDRIRYERYGLGFDTLALLKSYGHTLHEVGEQGVAQGIAYDPKEDVLEAGADRRRGDGAAAGR
jgi:gamma-glutamyltranspeptidase / glutathione hydrolase